MRLSINRLFAGSALLLAAGCAGVQEEAAAPEAPAIDLSLRTFADRLASEYDALAESEAMEGDWADSRLFAAKAREARLTGEPLPDPFETRGIPERWLAELQAARDLLVDSFERGMREIDGELAANAQAYFDCWVQEAEEDYQFDDIATCRAGFYALAPTLEEVASLTWVVLLPNENGASAVVVAIADQSITLDEPYEAALGNEDRAQTAELTEGAVSRLFEDTLAAEPPAPARFILTFVTGGTDLTEEGQRQLELAADEIRNRQIADATVIGHTDTVGRAALNVRLARQRADAIAESLGALDIAPRFLEVESFGEADPLVITGDEVEEERNRRVEIIVR